MSCFIDPEVLIKEVHTRPLLYATTLPEYSNKKLKYSAWEDITKNISEEWDTLTSEEKKHRCRDVQAKWKHLRDNFRREFQAQKDTTPVPGAKKKKKYRYFNELLFLVPHVKDVRIPGNNSTPTNVPEQNTTVEVPLTPNIEVPVIPHVENTPAGPSTATAPVTEPPKKRKKTSSLEAAIVKAFKNEISDTDEDKTFCLSLIQSLKKMDDDNKILAKIEILNVIRTFSNKLRNTIIKEEFSGGF